MGILTTLVLFLLVNGFVINVLESKLPLKLGKIFSSFSFRVAGTMCATTFEVPSADSLTLIFHAVNKELLQETAFMVYSLCPRLPVMRKS